MQIRRCAIELPNVLKLFEVQKASLSLRCLLGFKVRRQTRSRASHLVKLPKDSLRQNNLEIQMQARRDPKIPYLLLDRIFGIWFLHVY